MAISGKEMIKALKNIGFTIDHITGSHYILKRGNDRETIPVHGNKDLNKRLEKEIKKRWGLK